MEDIYREIILDHFKNPRNYGKLKNPTSSFSLYNSACGDRIEIQIKLEIRNSKLEDRKITEIKFTGEGCAISMASASMLTEKVLGQNIAEINKLGTSDILQMLGTTLTPTRLKCALLPLEVLHKTVGLLK